MWALVIQRSPHSRCQLLSLGQYGDSKGSQAGSQSSRHTLQPYLALEVSEVGQDHFVDALLLGAGVGTRVRDWESMLGGATVLKSFYFAFNCVCVRAPWSWSYTQL